MANLLTINELPFVMCRQGASKSFELDMILARVCRRVVEGDFRVCSSLCPVSRLTPNSSNATLTYGLFTDYPEANERHFAFMLEGLAGVAANVRERGIRLVTGMKRPGEACLALAPDAALVVCDVAIYAVRSSGAKPWPARRDVRSSR